MRRSGGHLRPDLPHNTVRQRRAARHKNTNCSRRKAGGNKTAPATRQFAVCDTDAGVDYAESASIQGSLDLSLMSRPN